MKKIVFLIILSLLAISQSMALRVVLSGNISENITLLAEDCNILEGCVVIDSGVTVTIEPGTVIYGRTSITGVGALVVSRGGKLIANGTPTQPIVFTSGLVPRSSGDWGGIIIVGSAKNNQPGGLFEVDAPCTLQAGGFNDADSSGSLKYVQINYAGRNSPSGKKFNGLTLASVGRKTNLSKIQISYCNNDAFEFLGGKVNGRFLISYNNTGVGFKKDFGYRGYLFFAIDVDADSVAQNPACQPNGWASWINLNPQADTYCTGLYPPFAGRLGNDDDASADFYNTP